MKTKIGKRALPVLLSLLLLVGLIPMAVFAAENAPEENWIDFAAESFAGGDGTKENPYQIATAEQLAKLAKDVNSGTDYQKEYFKLMDNIDLSGKEWEPIGYTEGGGSIHNFEGMFDGNNKTVSGMYVDVRNEKSEGGLFGVIAATSMDDASVKNLTVEGEVHSGWGLGEFDDPAAGLLIGRITRNMTHKAEYAVVTNCHVRGTVDSEANMAGGMIGSAAYTRISDCSSDVTVAGSGDVGGLVGYSYAGSYENCTASGTVTGDWNVAGFAGRLCGGSYDNVEPVTVEKCMASVDVTAYDWRAGGFAGYTEDSRISDCVAQGSVTSHLETDKPKAGGFVGELYGLDGLEVIISDCYAAVEVKTSHLTIPGGGFIGYEDGGTTQGCFYNDESGIEAVGESVTEGTRDMTAETMSGVLKKICENYYVEHDYSEEWTEDTAPTCTEAGSKSHHCTRCGDKTDVTEVPSLGGHSFTNYAADNNATCTENGTETAKCDRCDATNKREIADSALGHDWGEPEWSWSDDGKIATATFTCNRDSSHSEMPAVTVTPAVKAPATCTEKGTTTYTATVELEGKTYTSTKDVADIPAAGHGETETVNAKEATCTAEGYTGDKICTVCGEVVEAGKTVAKTAHAFKDGKCTVCGASDPDYVPATPEQPDSDSPQTGDDSNMVLWLVLMLTAGAGLTVLGIYGKRRRINNK